LRSGFHWRLLLPEGEHVIGIEALLDGEWMELDTRQVVVRKAPVVANIDTPGDARVEEGIVRFSGWCLHPHRRVLDLRLLVGDIEMRCTHGLGRADVAESFPDAPNAAFAGFEATLPLAPGVYQVRLKAVLDNGDVSLHEARAPLRVCRRPLATRITDRAQRLRVLLGYVAVRGGRWIKHNRRIPAWNEWPELKRRLFAGYGGYLAERGAPHALGGFLIPAPRDPYQQWIDVNPVTDGTRRRLRERLQAAAARLPKLSVVMPVYNPPIDLLCEAIESVRGQIFERWELCIADDASTDPEVLAKLEELARGDERIRLVARPENGHISRATNSAAELATGSFLVFLDQDDLLTEDALAEIALAVSDNTDADILYSDDDKIGEDRQRFAPQFKPDWSPELLLSYMYFSHVFVVRSTLFRELGGMRVGFEGSQDYDFALRASERSRRVVHIPKVLYHWRVLPGSTASSGAAKPESFDGGRRAVQDALRRRGLAGDAIHPEWALRTGLGIYGIRFPDDGPRVSIIIPTKNGLEMLRRCVDSLLKTTYRNYEVIIIDNESDEPATLHYLASLHHRVERIPNPAGRFNYAYINNRAAEKATGEYLLFLNNDTEVMNPHWLSQMVGFQQMQGVGAVGARLLFPDRRIQHAGIVHGYYHGLAGPAFKLLPEWHQGYLSYACVSRNYSAVTAACMLTPKRLFIESGGFDEQAFEVAYNDVDYCYRLTERGFRCVYSPESELLHYEGHTRGFMDRPHEIAAFRRKYAGFRDSYYSPYLSLDDEQFRIMPRRLVDASDRKPVRALMCAFNLNWEGAPYSQLELTLGLKRRGDLEPIVYSPNDGPLRKAYEDAGIEVHVFEHPLSGAIDANDFDRSIEAFSQFIRNLGVDIVYGNTLQTFYAMAAADRLGLPCLWNPRESESWQTYFNYLPLEIIPRALQCFEYPYKVIFVAEATRQVWAPLDSRLNFTVIHNGLDAARVTDQALAYPRRQARESLGVRDDQVMVLLPGTVCERKGQHDLARALGRLGAEQLSKLRCFIVGDRPSAYSLELKAIMDASSEQVRKCLSVLPETDEIARFYSAADVFLCTSRVESFPRVVLEGMAHGLPIVTTPVYGIREQVAEHVNALFFQPGDDAVLAEHIARLVDDEAERLRMAQNSPHVLSTLNNYDDMVGAYAELFREAAAIAR
jgi:glycosyltransferase involved in cell wall biosynthesis